MTPAYPTSLENIEPWASLNNRPIDEARRRFVQAAAVYVVAGEPRLGRGLRLFGSGALSLFHGGDRPGEDLDFWCDPLLASDEIQKESILRQLSTLFNRDLRAFVPFEDFWRPLLKQAVTVQLTSADVLDVEWTRMTLTFDPSRSIHVMSRDAVLAAKLVSLASRLGPSKSRAQDVLDVAAFKLGSYDVNWNRVIELAADLIKRHDTQLTHKRIQEFRDGAKSDYESKYAGVIPFESAWREFASLLERLA